MNRKILILISIIVTTLIIAGIVLINIFAPKKSTNSNEKAQSQLNSNLNTTIDSANQFGNDVQKLPDTVNSTLDQSNSSSAVVANFDKINNYQQFEVKSLTPTKGLLEVDQSYYQNDAFYSLLQNYPIFERDSDFLNKDKAYFIFDYSNKTSLFLGYGLSIKEKVAINDKNYWFFGMYGTLGQAHFFLLDENLENKTELKLPKDDVVSKIEFENPDKLKITYSSANDDSNTIEIYKISDLEKEILNEDGIIEGVDDGTKMDIQSSFFPAPNPQSEATPEIDYGDAQDSISVVQ
jgi:hypothetical protein